MSSNNQDPPIEASSAATPASSDASPAVLAERVRLLERKLKWSRAFNSMVLCALIGACILAFLMPRLIVFWEGGSNNVCESFATQVIRKLHTFEFVGLCGGMLAGLIFFFVRERRRK